MEGSTILGVRASTCRRTSPLLTVLRLVEAVRSYFIALGAGGNTGGRNLGFAAGDRYRVYRQEDIETMKLIVCQNKTGIPLDDMKPYLSLSYGDDITRFPELYDKIDNHQGAGCRFYRL